MLKKIRSASKKSLFLDTTVFMLLIAFVFCFVGCGMVRNEASQRLTEEQIAELRQEYPICGDMGLVSMKIPTISEIKEVYDTFVYGTVKGEMSTYSKNISTGSSELDAKRNNNGIGDTFEFYAYTVSVIEDTSEIYKAGDEISIVSNKEKIDFNPHFSDGMKVVFPAGSENGEDARVSYSVYGMYYVTEDDYAISAYDETQTMEKALSGIKVEELLEELKNN